MCTVVLDRVNLRRYKELSAISSSDTLASTVQIQSQKPAYRTPSIRRIPLSCGRPDASIAQPG